MSNEDTPSNFSRETNGDVGDPQLSSGSVSTRISFLTRENDKRMREVDTLTEKIDEVLLGLTMLRLRVEDANAGVKRMGTKVIGVAAVSVLSMFAGSFAGSFVAGLVWHWLNK